MTQVGEKDAAAVLGAYVATPRGGEILMGDDYGAECEVASAAGPVLYTYARERSSSSRVLLVILLSFATSPPPPRTRALDICNITSKAVATPVRMCIHTHTYAL